MLTSSHQRRRKTSVAHGKSLRFWAGSTTHYQYHQLTTTTTMCNDVRSHSTRTCSPLTHETCNALAVKQVGGRQEPRTQTNTKVQEPRSLQGAKQRRQGVQRPPGRSQLRRQRRIEGGERRNATENTTRRTRAVTTAAGKTTTVTGRRKTSTDRKKATTYRRRGVARSAGGRGESGGGKGFEAHLGARGRCGEPLRRSGEVRGYIVETD